MSCVVCVVNSGDEVSKVRPDRNICIINRFTYVYWGCGVAVFFQDIRDSSSEIYNIEPLYILTGAKLWNSVIKNV